jgi:hypothetical protein
MSGAAGERLLSAAPAIGGASLSRAMTRSHWVKQLQLLRELLPHAAQFGVLVDPAAPNIPSIIAKLQTASRTLGLQLVVLNASTDGDLETAFARFRNSMLVRSWSSPVPSTCSARNNS